MYLRTVARDSPVPVAICRWLMPDRQRRTTSAISTLDTSLYAIAAPYIQDAAMVANPAHRVVNLLAKWPIVPGDLSFSRPPPSYTTSWDSTNLPAGTGDEAVGHGLGKLDCGYDSSTLFGTNRGLTTDESYDKPVWKDGWPTPSYHRLAAAAESYYVSARRLRHA